MTTFVRIPHFTQQFAAVDKDGRFNNGTVRALNDAFKQIAEAVNAIADIPEIQAALVDLDTATAAATAAAAAANTAAATTTAATNLANSSVSGLTMIATDAGASVTITISGHTRVYGDNSSVAVTGGSVTGLAYDTQYFIYYDQPSRSGGTVTYQATTAASTASQTGDRHVVGAVKTPLSGGTPEPGDPVLPPGPGAIKGLE